MQYQVLPYINPELVFALVANTPGIIYLDSSMQQHEHYGRYSFIMLNPLLTFNAANTKFSQDVLLWQQLLSANQTKVNSNLPPFSAGLVGYLSYDLGKQLEYIPSQSQNIVPDYYLGLYNQVIAFDHILHQCYIMVTPIMGYKLDYAAQFESLLALYNKASTTSLASFTKLPSLALKSNFTELQYKKAVEQAREYILAGDIFEVNLSQQFSVAIEEDYPFDLLYRKLRQVNPAPFSAYLNLGQLRILSASPERFLSIRDRHVETRPIKGTSKRSLNPIDDYQLAQSLKNSSKDRAENIMIVDLMRNDLAKICIPSSINVSQLCGVESFTNLHHLVSVIEGQLCEERSIFDIIPACFPGGSITGAPKIRAMQIIEELEERRRGVYCGSIGYFSFNGNVDLSIAIRTLVSNKNELCYNVGGAVTLDSDPLSEYYETLIKGQKLAEAINGV